MLKTLVNSLYQLQKIRIQFGNRLCANFYARNGVKPGDKTDDFIVKWAKEVGYPIVEDEVPEMIDIIMHGYKALITTAVKRPRKGDLIAGLPDRAIFKGNGIITNHTDGVLVQSLIALEQQEANLVKEMLALLPTYPIWTNWMLGVRGLGPQMGSIIISEIDIHKATTTSKIWKYAGLDCLPNGEGRSRKAGHLVERTFVNREGEEDTRMGITFNPFLKTKLIGVLAPSFIKLNNPTYRLIYDNYKNRIKLRDPDRSKGHVHAMSVRYMMKRFLCDLYMAWRHLENLPITEEYAVRKLGLVHHT